MDVPNVPVEGLLAAFHIASAATSFFDNLTSLATRTGLGKRIVEWIKADPQRREFTKAWEVAHTRFAREYPDEAVRFFTRDRLQTIVPRFLERYQGEVRTEAFAEHLALIWAETLPDIVSNDQQGKLQEVATRFLALLDEELGRQPSFRELIKVYVLQEISRSSAETSTNTADILREMQTLNARLGLQISQDSATQGAVEVDVAQVAPNAFTPADDLNLILPANFLGRDRETSWALDRLRRFLPCFCSLCGLGGVGKTALASAIIQQARQEGRFTGGVALVDCSDTPDAIAVLRAALTRFCPPSVLAEKSLPELASIAGQCLRGRDAMVVLDDVSPDLDLAAVARPLLNAGASILATSRHIVPASIAGPEARQEVGLLSSGDALALFATTLGHNGPAALSASDHVAAVAIVDMLGCHTLAIKLAAAYARDYGRDLAALAEELRTPERTLNLPEDGEYSAVAKMVAHSIDRLNLHVRRLFIGLAAFGTLEFSRNAVMVLGIELGLTQEQSTRAIDTLVQRALVNAWTDTAMSQDSHRERLQLHPILDAFARREFETLPDDDKLTAQRAVANYYRYYIEKRALATLARDEANIVSALSWAIDTQVASLVAPLCLRMQYLWQRNSNIAAAVRFLPAGVGAAIFLADQSDDADAKLFAAAQLLSLGQLLVAYRHEDEALDYLSQARDRFTTLSDSKGMGAALIALAAIEIRKGNLDRAEELCSAAREHFVEVDDTEGEASALHMLANVSHALRDYDIADRRANEAVELFRELGMEREEGVLLVELASIADSRGHLQESAQYLQAAEAILRRLGTRIDLAACLHQLGRLALYHGNPPTYRVPTEAGILAQRAQAAIAYFEDELRLLQGTFDFDAIADATFELSGAHLWMARSDVDKDTNLTLSQQYSELAVEATTKGHNQSRLPSILTKLGDIALLQGKKKEAERKFREAFKLVHSRQDPLGIAVVSRDLGILLITKFGKREEGCQRLSEASRQFAQIGRHDDADQARELRKRLCGEER